MYNLKGLGASKAGGRWNPPGCACIYTSEHVSLAMIEKLVHAQMISDMKDIALMTFEINRPELLYILDLQKLKKGWKNDIRYTQWIGAQILKYEDYAGFIAPSVVVPNELNIILLANPRAENGIVQTDAALFPFDERLRRLFKD